MSEERYQVRESSSNESSAWDLRVLDRSRSPDAHRVELDSTRERDSIHDTVIVQRQRGAKNWEPMQYYSQKLKERKEQGGEVKIMNKTIAVSENKKEPRKFFTKAFDPEKKPEPQKEEVIRAGCSWFGIGGLWNKAHEYSRYAVRNNPHVCQDHENVPFGTILQPAITFSRVLDHQTGQTMEYRRRQGEFKTTLSWPLRKQLLAEIEFITLFGYPHCIVVIAGAAPGYHISLLSEMFPFVTFHLYDVNSFGVEASSRILIQNSLFTDEVASTYAGQDVLFISDVRSVSLTASFDSRLAEVIAADQVAQMGWVKLMKPVKSMLTFRLPWTPGETNYLAGSLFLPVWGQRTNTEVYLVCDHDQETLYNHTRHEQQMFYFNTFIRVQVYPHEVLGGEGIDHCYDCRSEIEILSNYILLSAKLNQVYDFNSNSFSVSTECTPPTWNEQLELDNLPDLLTEEQLHIRIKEFSKKISRELGNRTLSHPQPSS